MFVFLTVMKDKQEADRGLESQRLKMMKEKNDADEDLEAQKLAIEQRKVDLEECKWQLEAEERRTQLTEKAAMLKLLQRNDKQ